MSHFGEDVLVCAHPAIGAGFSTMCFSTVFLVINAFTGIMTHELETVLYINYTNTYSEVKFWTHLRLHICNINKLLLCASLH